MSTRAIPVGESARTSTACARNTPYGVALVGRECRLPVGRRRHQPEHPGLGQHLRGEERPDRVPPGEPPGQRRHLQHGVLAQQFGQRLRVGVLEGGREPVERRGCPGSFGSAVSSSAGSARVSWAGPAAARC